MKDKLILGIVAITLILTGFNTYLITQNKAKPNITPAKSEANNATNNVVTPTNTNTQINTNTNNINALNNMSGTSNAASISFEKTLHDYGTINETSENKYSFKFTNPGDTPLIISDAKGSCGCTVPNYPKEPIPPGGTGEIEVIYKPKGQSGPQTKTVTITANTDVPTTVLTIKGTVVEGL